MRFRKLPVIGFSFLTSLIFNTSNFCCFCFFALRDISDIFIFSFTTPSIPPRGDFYARKKTEQIKLVKVHEQANETLNELNQQQNVLQIT